MKQRRLGYWLAVGAIAFLVFSIAYMVNGGVRTIADTTGKTITSVMSLNHTSTAEKDTIPPSGPEQPKENPVQTEPAQPAEEPGQSERTAGSENNGTQPPKPDFPPAASRDSTSGRDLWIDVSIGEQKVRVYDRQEVIREWSVSTGKNNSTPLGKFKIQNRGEWFFSEKYQQGGKWWVSFKDWGTYLFHSVPMDRNQNLIAEEAEKLGTPASHGCIRLEVEAARWIFDNIPQGTQVIIHQ
jgi:lipoprotein-anchoring transpeptidase ErfK/SrfK